MMRRATNKCFIKMRTKIKTCCFSKTDIKKESFINIRCSKIVQEQFTSRHCPLWKLPLKNHLSVDNTESKFS